MYALSLHDALPIWRWLHRGYERSRWHGGHDDGIGCGGYGRRGGVARCGGERHGEDVRPKLHGGGGWDGVRGPGGARAGLSAPGVERGDTGGGGGQLLARLPRIDGSQDRYRIE